MKVLLISPSAKTCRYKEVYVLAMKNMWSMDSDKCLNKALRTTLVILFILQLVSTLERQIFDFLGYMWAPIIGNFFQIIIVIIGIFGACKFCKSLVIVYATWTLLWLGWNIFVICLYLEVGILNRNRERYILTIGTEGKSWWLEHGIGCEVTNSSWEEEEGVNQGRNNPPEAYVVGCILQYYYVEVIHAAVQCLLALLGFVASCVCIYFLFEDDEDSLSLANDELEFVKMRYHTPVHMSAYNDKMCFDNINLTTELTPSSPRSRNRGEREVPPGYDTTMKTMNAAEYNYYGDQRQSPWSQANTRSVRSTHKQAEGSVNNITYSEPVNNLPWVQITPSTNSESSMFRHFP
uniref:Sodium/potassium-transporting ATPase subunit beta-1-interacting protein n=1 Tax=Arion vulgaris TaxID=1028688 RepID=A0A0B6Y8G1_9EUPU